MASTNNSPQPDSLLLRLSTLEQLVQHQQQVMANQEAVIQLLQTQSQPQGPATPPATTTEVPYSPTTSESPGASLVRARAPDPFDGTDLSLASGFIQSLSQYIGLGSYPTETAKLEFALTYFRMPAQKWILGAYRAGAIKTFAALVQNFNSVYLVDADLEKEDSLDKLTSLRQSDSQSVSDHYSQFLALSYTSGASQDSSHAQIFFASLRLGLRRSMLRDSNFSRTSLASVLQTALRHERAYNASRANSSSETPIPRRQPAVAAPPAPAVPPILQRIGPRVIPPAAGPQPMDLDAAQVHQSRPRLTPEERQRRVDNNLCIVCGDPNHYRNNCPSATYKRQRTAAVNAVQASGVGTTQSAAGNAQVATAHTQPPAPQPDDSLDLAYLETANWDSDDLNEPWE